MGFVTSNPVLPDNATKADDYDVVFDNTQALAAIRIERFMGGESFIAYTDTSYVDIESKIQIAIDGTKLTGLTVYFEFMALVDSGTGYARIYDETAAGALSGSEVSFTNTTVGRKASGSLTLPSAAHSYKVEVKGSAASALPRVWGTKLIAYKQRKREIMGKTHIDREQIGSRIIELGKMRIQLIAELYQIKERQENCEANIHALNGGINELKRFAEMDEEARTDGT